jgi:hypothetical protein
MNRNVLLISAWAVLLGGGCQDDGPRPESSAPEPAVEDGDAAAGRQEAQPKRAAAADDRAAGAVDGGGEATGAPGGAKAEPVMRTVQLEADDGRVLTLELDLSGQKLRLEVPEDRATSFPAGRQRSQPARLHASFAEVLPAREAFVPAAALAFKAKQFDDGLYAAVELARDRGLGRCPDKGALVAELLAGVLGRPKGAGRLPAAVLLTAALELGGEPPQVEAAVASRAAARVERFMKVPRLSRPIGFYSWSPELERIFRRDRMLQSKLEPPAAARQLAAVLAADAERRRDYGALLELDARLTNPFTAADLRPAAAALAAGEEPQLPADIRLFPPSRSHEAELIKKLYGDKPIPEGFDLAEALIERIRSGAIDLQPDADAGWYDHQVHALEPLVRPAAMPEARSLQLDESYRRELVGLFRSLLALTRETHIKQLETPVVGAGGVLDQLRVEVQPGLTLEPLASYYLRRARSYGFVQRVLEAAFGPQALSEMHRRTAGGSIGMPLGEELQRMRTLFRGAYRATCAQIGLPPVLDGAGAQAERNLFAAFRDGLAEDSDLGRDIRMLVPVFYDRLRSKTKVWAVLGVAERRLRVGYAEPPALTAIRDAAGEPLEPGAVEVSYGRDTYPLVYVVSAEVYVDEVLDRQAFRALCDQHQTQAAILAALRGRSAEP